jgi:polyisoprenoid-binding protein YceI
MTPTTAIATRTYQVDKAHSEAGFQVRHLLTRVRGHFTDFDGTIDLDPADFTEASVNFTIQAASIHTNEPTRDAHLRSSDFFAVDEHPTLTFVSRTVKPHGADAFDVTGDLTIRGVTKTVTLPVQYLGTATDPWGNEKLSFEIETTLNRKDYGLTWNAALETGGFLVGDEVRVSSRQAVVGRAPAGTATSRLYPGWELALLWRFRESLCGFSRCWSSRLPITVLAVFYLFGFQIEFAGSGWPRPRDRRPA